METVNYLKADKAMEPDVIWSQSKDKNRKKEPSQGMPRIPLETVGRDKENYF